MGYSSDLGSGNVKDICPLTGYPRDVLGHQLDPISPKDGGVVVGWDKPGTTLPNFTSPYGHLEFVTGSEDDFFCYDYAVINAGPRGKFIVLHATVNSETSSFIDSAGYEVLPVNTEDECREAAKTAFGMINYRNAVPHSNRGWNQDLSYFGRAVTHALFPSSFQKWDKKCGRPTDWATNRMLRFGGKRIDETISEILYPFPEKTAKRKRR